MFTKIALSFKEAVDLELLEQGVGIKLVRIIGQARFRSREGWTDLYPVIIDTGAPVSVLPRRIWDRVEVKRLAEHTLRGIVPKKECSLPVVVGELTCLLADEENVTPYLSILAYLADTDEIPPLIGFAGILDKFKINIDYFQNKVYMEENG